MPDGAWITHSRCNARVHHRVHCDMQNADPALIAMLTKGATSWRDHVPFNITNLEPQCRDLVHEQDKIGWRQMFNGRWSKKWAKLQERHERETDLTGGNKY